MALKGLKRRLEAIQALKLSYEAVAAKRESEERDVECNEVTREMHRIVLSMRREELAEWIVSALQSLHNEGTIEGADAEDVSEEEKVEACFRFISLEQKQSGDKRSSYFNKVYEWHLHGSLTEGEAYLLRSSIYCKAKCLLQAQVDAKRAVACTHKYYNELSKHNSARSTMIRKYGDLAKSYFQLGVAYTCEGKEHVDVDLVQGVKSFSQACEYDGKEEKYQSKLKEWSEQLSPQQTQRVQDALKEAQAGEYGRSHVFESSSCENSRVLEADLSMTFMGATRKDLTAAAREELRKCLARYCQCESLMEVQLSSIKFKQDEGLTVGLQIHMKCGEKDIRHENLKDLVDKITSADGVKELVSILDGKEIERQLGRDIVKAHGKISDITDDFRKQQQSEDFEFSSFVRGKSDLDKENVPVPSRPKTEIELPYKMYRLVNSDGTPCERIDKHAFCMSRVYYSNTDLPQEVYAQLCDSSLRWRQSSDEVKIVLLTVPPGLKASKDLVVEVLPDFVKCANKASGDVYFEGQLCRGVIPEQSLWEYDSGNGQVTFYLKKMNLELFSKSHQHAEMWWPKLCAHHCEIQWDDYEKDYSDLPPEIMRQYAKNEEQSKMLNNVEYKERLKKEHLQECDERRRRSRQERLHFFRSGERLSWVDLNQGKKANKGLIPNTS